MLVSLGLLRTRQAAGGAGNDGTLQTILAQLGLTTGLKVCLDAGDAISYPGTGQLWNDRSGNGHNFFLGANDSVTVTDPTFNGTPGGKSSNEYLSFDGGDLLTIAGGNPAWVNDLHKDNARFGCMAWIRPTNVVSQRFLGTATTTTEHGILWGTTSGGLLNQNVYNGAGTARAFNSSAALQTNAWQMVAWSHDETVGSNGAIAQLNATQLLATSTFTSPSTSNATRTMQLGANGASASLLAAGTRLGMFAIWQGAAPSSAQLSALFEATRARYGV